MGLPVLPIPVEEAITYLLTQKTEFDVIVKRWVNELENGLECFRAEGGRRGAHPKCILNIYKVSNNIYGQVKVLKKEVTTINEEVKTLRSPGGDYNKIKKRRDNCKNKLEEIKDTGLASAPRKNRSKDILLEEYYMDTFYACAILGGIYQLYNYYKIITK